MIKVFGAGYSLDTHLLRCPMDGAADWWSAKPISSLSSSNMNVNPKFCMSDVGIAKPGSLVKTPDGLGFVSTNPNDHMRRHSVAELTLAGERPEFQYRFEIRSDVLNFGENYEIEWDITAAVIINVHPNRSAGACLYTRDDKFYVLVGIPASHEYRLLDLESGSLLIDRGEQMTCFKRWKISIRDAHGQSTQLARIVIDP